MGTPASIVCDMPLHQTPKSCVRKRASANIFQGVGLLQLHRLFHSSGDAQAEERAQLVWDCAGNQCIAQALQQLHRKQRRRRLHSNLRPPSESSGPKLLELQHFSGLRIEDCATSCADTDGGGSSSKKREAAGPTCQYPSSHCRQKKWGKGPAGYLHQLHR